MIEELKRNGSQQGSSLHHGRRFFFFSEAPTFVTCVVLVSALCQKNSRPTTRGQDRSDLFQRGRFFLTVRFFYLRLVCVVNGQLVWFFYLQLNFVFFLLTVEFF